MRKRPPLCINVIKPLLGENPGVRRGLPLESGAKAWPVTLQTQHMVANERWQTDPALARTNTPPLLGERTQLLTPLNPMPCVAVILNSMLPRPLLPNEQSTTRPWLRSSCEQSLLLPSGPILQTCPVEHALEYRLPSVRFVVLVRSGKKVSTYLNKRSETPPTRPPTHDPRT